MKKAEDIATQLQLRLEVIETGYGELEPMLGRALSGIAVRVESRPDLGH